MVLKSINPAGPANSGMNAFTISAGPRSDQERAAARAHAEWKQGLITELEAHGLKTGRSPYWSLVPKFELTQENEAKYASIAEAFAAAHGTEPAGEPGWGWYVNHWGTRSNGEASRDYWDIQPEGEDGNVRAVVTFETVWCPPLPILDAIAARLPDGVRMTVRVYLDADESIEKYESRDGEVPLVEVVVPE